MNRVHARQPGPVFFLLGLTGLALLPLGPELYLNLHNHEGLRAFARIAYYEAIVSFLLLVPALVLPPRGSRGWVLVVGWIMGVATVVVVWQPISIGARWDSTAHAALLQTAPEIVWGYVRAFVSWRLIAEVALVLTAFGGCIGLVRHAAVPSRRLAWSCVCAGFLLGGTGLSNAIRYGGNQMHALEMENGKKLWIADMGINKFHPVTLLLLTHYNYEVTHDFYLKVFHNLAAHAAEFQGARPVPRAEQPRVIVVVMGESASRRHWSLYGYGRETNPELRALGDKVVLFSDVVSARVGTQDELRRIFTFKASGLPVFPVFDAAGYRTHWFSAQFDQRSNHVQIAALIQSCDEKKFLNGSFDENLLPFAQRAMAEPGRHIIFLHLFGSHVRYDDRYPPAFAVFHGGSERAHRLAAYDNTIRYTDHVLAAVIALLRRRAEPACLLYLSDHAEDVYDSNPEVYLFRSDALATNPMYEVPFLAWFSPEYQAGNPDVVRVATANRDRPFATDSLSSSLIELARFTHPLSNPPDSIFSPAFVQQDRHVGAAGRIYHKGK